MQAPQPATPKMKSASDELKAMLGVSQVRSHGACTRRDGAETNAARRKLGCVVSYTTQPIGHACALSTQFVRQQPEHGDTAQTVSMAELSNLKAHIGVNPEVRWSCGLQLSRTYVPSDHGLARFASARVGVQVTNATAEKHFESSSIAPESDAHVKLLGCDVRRALCDWAHRRDPFLLSFFPSLLLFISSPLYPRPARTRERSLGEPAARLMVLMGVAASFEARLTWHVSGCEWCGGMNAVLLSGHGRSRLQL